MDTGSRGLLSTDYELTGYRLHRYRLYRMLLFPDDPHELFNSIVFDRLLPPFNCHLTVITITHLTV